MQFYDSSKATNAISQEIDRLCDTTDTSYPRLDKTARVNTAMEELVGEIINADGAWQYDDTNQTDSPRGRGNLVEGQSVYSFASEYLKIMSVEVLLNDGKTYRRLEQLDQDDLDGLSVEEYFGTNASGTYPNNIAKSLPNFYDIEGDTVRLFPAPTSTSVTLTNGLRIWFKRAPVAFTAVSTTATDTTTPGLPSSYHVILAYMAALPYCMTYKKDRVALYENKIESLKKKLIAYYTKRNPDKRPTMTGKKINYI